MTLETIKQKLEQSQHNLPAWNAHLKMMPPQRGTFSQEEIEAKNPKKAAVLILLYLKNNEFFFPLIERQTYDGTHSGEISLPGGKVDKQDTTFKDTALREAMEEIGINTNNVSPIFSLSEIYIPPSNFSVHPFVGIYTENPIFIPDSREVKKVIEVSLNNFLTSHKIETLSITRKQNTFEVPSYSIENHYIWGATAMILSELREVLLY